MQRFFNTAGVCEPEDHYLLPPLRRLPNVEQLINEKAYFVVHAPRQSGKTTAFHHLARKLTAEGRYADPATEVTAAHVDKAKEALILRRDTHVDSLVHRLREARIRQVIEPILAGEIPEVPEDDLAFVEDLGLVAMGPTGYGMANPIYREIIPRALTSVTERFLPVDAPSYILPDGGLDFDRLLDQFVAFWRQHAESFLKRQPYSEAAAQLICMAYLQRVINGGGHIDREYAAGSGRIDLCLRWPRPDGILERFALELKVWRQGQPDPIQDGLEQLSGYLERLGLGEGTLVIFDTRQSALPFAERGSRETGTRAGRDILVLRL